MNQLQLLKRIFYAHILSFPQLQGQRYLDSEDFIKKMHANDAQNPQYRAMLETPKAQKKPLIQPLAVLLNRPLTLEKIKRKCQVFYAFLSTRHQVIAAESIARCQNRNETIAQAYFSGQHTMAAIAKYFNLHYATVSPIVSKRE